MRGETDVKKRTIKIEILDQYSRSKSNVGKALVGGAIFGVVGAVAGASAKNTESKTRFIEYFNDGTNRVTECETGSANYRLMMNLKVTVEKAMCPVQCVETGEIYPDMYTAQEQTGIKKIMMACDNPKKKAGGFHWKYYREDEQP